MIEDNFIKDPTQESSTHRGKNPLEKPICSKLEDDASFSHKNGKEDEVCLHDQKNEHEEYEEITMDLKT